MTTDYQPPSAPQRDPQPGPRENLRSRRARLLRGEDAPAPDAPAPERSGPKLTTQQRTALISAIATYWHTDTIRQVIAEEHPDFPSFSDALVRYYRGRIDAGALRAAEQARDRALASGLALKATRVAHLARMHDQLASVPIVTRLQAVNAAGELEERHVLRLDVARTRRELLEQIAHELDAGAGRPLPGSPLGAGAAGAEDDEPGLEVDTGRHELADLLGDLDLRRQAMSTARLQAERVAAQAEARR